MTEWVPLTEAARQIGVSRQWLHQEAKAGRLATQRFGLMYYLRPEEIDRYAKLLNRSRAARDRRQRQRANAAARRADENPGS